MDSASTLSSYSATFSIVINRRACLPESFCSEFDRILKQGCLGMCSSLYVSMMVGNQNTNRPVKELPMSAVAYQNQRIDERQYLSSSASWQQTSRDRQGCQEHHIRHRTTHDHPSYCFESRASATSKTSSSSRDVVGSSMFTYNSWGIGLQFFPSRLPTFLALSLNPYGANVQSVLMCLFSFVAKRG